MVLGDAGNADAGDDAAETSTPGPVPEWAAQEPPGTATGPPGSRSGRELPPLERRLGYAVRDAGDAWVTGPEGQRFWGRFGAAGLLCWHRELGVLLQHRVGWSHFGGTWGLPGGARKQGEDAVTAAIREATEEATVPADVLRVMDQHVLDLGFWSYTTVIAEALEPFEPQIGDPESVALAWVPVAEILDRPLHPGFKAAWPDLRTRLS